MKISKNILAFLAAAPLLLEASPLCDTSTIPPAFDQSCQNACSTGADAGALVGPGVLTSETSTYAVAGFYFGYQNWGGCIGMVQIMTNAYNGLTEEEREQVFLLSVGLDQFKSADQNFCQGFAACADDDWWTAWEVNQRDVVFYVKKDDDSWEYYCRYSMNAGKDDFDDTIRDMLSSLDGVASNETLIEQDDPSETLIEQDDPSETLIEQDDPSETLIEQDDPSDTSLSNISSSSSSSSSTLFFVISAAVLGWSIV